MFNCLSLTLLLVLGSVSTISGRCWWTQCQSQYEADFCPASSSNRGQKYDGCDADSVDVYCCTDDEGQGGQSFYAGQDQTQGNYGVGQQFQQGYVDPSQTGYGGIGGQSQGGYGGIGGQSQGGYSGGQNGYAGQDQSGYSGGQGGYSGQGQQQNLYAQQGQGGQSGYMQY